MPRRLLRFAVALLLAIPPVGARAQRLSLGMQVTPATGPYKLSGTVINAVTGEPVRRALVSLYLGGPRATMLTDAEGRFEFDNLPEGATAVTVQKPGFFSEEQVSQRHNVTYYPGGGGFAAVGLNRWSVPANQTSVGPDAPPAVVKLFPEGVIFGRVEANGEPVEELQLQIMAWRIENGRRVWRSLGVASSNDEGQYRFANLIPGSYYVAAAPDAGPRVDPRNAKLKMTYPETFYPGVADRDAASPIEIVPGAQVEARFSLQAQPVFQVSGTVVGHEPGSSGSFSVLDRTGEPLETDVQYNFQTGEFHVPLPAGSYILNPVEFSPQGGDRLAALPLTVNRDISGLQIALISRPVISVTWRIEDVRPANANALGAVTAPPGRIAQPPMNVRLVSAFSAFDASAAQMKTDQGPSLVITAQPGTYAVEFDVYGDWYVASAQYGARDALNEDIVVPAGSAPPMSVTLRNDGAKLRGTISSGEQPVWGTVLLVGSHGPPRFAVAQGQGGFIFQQVPPGDYDVLAFDSIDQLEYRNPQVLSPYLAKASHVSLLPNGEASVNLELIRLDEAQH